MMSSPKEESMVDNTIPDMKPEQGQLSSEQEKQPGMGYASTAELCIIMPTLLLSMLLAALDRSIIGTAIPRITDEFHSLNAIGWYGSAYMLANCSTQLLYGRIYKFYNTKYVFVAAIGLFEIGSAVCGAAPSSNIFIIGRAIAGAGSSGMMSGGFMILTHVIPLHKRPIFFGLFGSVAGIAAVTGPLLGGAFTERLSWRWCFYINLPFAVVPILVVILFLRVAPPIEGNTSFKDQIKQLDPTGTTCLVASVVCLILALQWGGNTYTWSSGRMIALLVLFGVFMIAFIGVQLWKQDQGTVPPRIIRQRSIAAAFMFNFCCAAVVSILSYYIPLWFQAVKNVDPVKSGIMTIPYVIALTIATILAGIFTQKVGYYVPAMILGPVISTIGAGLLTTFKTTTGSPQWIGYQVVCGFGIGLGMQQSNLVVQAVLPKADISIGIALMFFAQQLGGAVFLAVGQNVLVSTLVKKLGGLPGVDAQTIAETGATQLRNVVSSSDLPHVLEGYNYALTMTFFVCVGTLCAQLVGALAVEWKSIKKNKTSKQDAPKKEEA